MDIIQLSWPRLLIGYAALLLPAALLLYFRTGLLKKLGTATLRMTVQLLLVGYYLEYLFKYDNPWLNLAWIVVMVVASDLATVDRSELRRKPLFISVFVATFIGLILIDFFFLEVVIRLPKVLAAQYTIPITGMILGNCLRSNVIGINSFYYGLKEQREVYHYYLACGATRNEALFPFFRDALRKSVNPTLATMATIGLVSLPGMMTGQILSGSSPLTAIKYQILIVIAIISGTVLAVFLALRLSMLSVFDEADLLDEQIFK